MGLYDDIVVGKRSGQVKLWNNAMEVYRVGSDVPVLTVYENYVCILCTNYSIAMREGGYVNIVNCKIESWTDEPLTEERLVDKYGNQLDRSSDDFKDYFFER